MGVNRRGMIASMFALPAAAAMAAAQETGQREPATTQGELPQQPTLAPEPPPAPPKPHPEAPVFFFKPDGPMPRDAHTRLAEELHEWSRGVGLPAGHAVLLPHGLDVHVSPPVPVITPEKAEEVRRQRQAEATAKANEERKKLEEMLEELKSRKQGDIA
jgi:hypothetical protein